MLHTDMTRTGWFEASDPAHRAPARERRVGHARQLPVDPDRLPAARRAPRLDRRHPGLLADGELPLRLRRVPHVVAARPRARAGAATTARCRSSSPRRSPSFGGGGPTAAWGDAATAVPTVLYERFGDLGVLEAQYPSMREWADAVLRDAGHQGPWAGRMQLGDWLDPSAPPDKPVPGQGRRRHRGDRLPRPVPPPGRGCRRSARLRRRRRDLRRARRAQPRRVRVALRDAGRPHDERRPHGVRPRPRVRSRDRSGAASGARRPARGRSSAKAGTASPPASSAHRS